MEEKVKVLHQQSNINDHTFRTVLEKSVVERFNGKPRVIGKIVLSGEEAEINDQYITCRKKMIRRCTLPNNSCT